MASEMTGTSFPHERRPSGRSELRRRQHGSKLCMRRLPAAESRAECARAYQPRGWAPGAASCGAIAPGLQSFPFPMSNQWSTINVYGTAESRAEGVT